jgi:hypothetical protein
MIEKKSKSDVSMDLEDKNQVVITPDDVSECAKFFEFFDIPITPNLQQAFNTFRADPTYYNQCELKYYLAEAVATSPHKIFDDEVFAQVRPETRDCYSELSFEREMERQLTSDADEKTE